ncbi:MAG: hypothetical protein LBT45_04005 [Rickettsiales bacterium]|nr:hypothetical protein [Rickettsiales bacterium]
MKKSKTRRLSAKISRRLCARALCLAIPILSAGCAKNIAANDFCIIYSPIFADYNSDTPETIRQIDWNNAAHGAVCGA